MTSDGAVTSGGAAAEGLLVERDGPLLRLVIDRPDKRNSLTDDMIAGLIEVVTAAGNDESVRAIVLSGAGEHFCAGFDIISRNAAAPDGTVRRPRAGSIQRRLPSQAHRLIPVLTETQVPVIAAVRGWVAGIGLAFALAADFTVASETATFWAPFSSRGFTPDSGVSWLLPRRVGEVRARRMLLLGEKVTGRQAADWEMIHECVPDAELEQRAGELAATLAGGATVAVGLTKMLMTTGRSATLAEHLRNESFAMELSSRSEDFREGLAAFAAKRPPRFTGR